MEIVCLLIYPKRAVPARNLTVLRITVNVIKKIKFVLIYASVLGVITTISPNGITLMRIKRAKREMLPLLFSQRITVS